MPEQRLFFEYINGVLSPFWYVLTFQLCEINWDKHVFYYQPIKPFEFVEREEYDESLPGVTIHLSDLVFNYDLPGQIGINLNLVRKRIERNGVEPEVVRQLILTAPELDDFINLLPTERKINFMLNC